MNDYATLFSERIGVYCVVADEKLIRLKNLKAVLIARLVPPRERARYLHERVGSNISYWSGLLAGQRPFGEKVARRIEEKLGLGSSKALDDEGPQAGTEALAQDALEIAEAFNALPHNVPQDADRRYQLYADFMAILTKRRAAAATDRESLPGAQPSGGHLLDS